MQKSRTLQTSGRVASATTSALSFPVLLFARARELVGSPRVEVVVPVPADTGVTLARVRASLRAAFPVLETLLASSSTALTVNCEYVDDEATCIVQPCDEVAVLPVVSGG